MMELDFWSEDFQLAREWGLEVPVAQTDGQFGDFKSTSRQSGDNALSLQPQGAPFKLEAFNEDDVLAAEWMESSDLGSFLDALGDNHDRLLPFESSLLELNPLAASEDPSMLKESFGSTLQLQAQPESIPKNSSHGIADHLAGLEFENLSPPDSPEQVAPVIKLEPLGSAASHMTVTTPESLLGSTELASEDFTFTELDFISFEDNTVGSVADAGDLLGSPLSVDDVESTISFSGPSSPEASQTSIIESSPELYKVISTSSIDASKRFSPYSRPKAKQAERKSETKASRKTRSPAQPVPDHVIMEHLDKKDRKKLQNKNAAIRYRMKKKEEAEGIKGEEQGLEEINTKLRTKVEDLQREIKYMKNLMEDVCKAKGIKL